MKIIVRRQPCPFGERYACHVEGALAVEVERVSEVAHRDEAQSLELKRASVIVRTGHQGQGAVTIGKPAGWMGQYKWPCAGRKLHASFPLHCRRHRILPLLQKGRIRPPQVDADCE